MTFKSLKNKRGYTLVELCIVIGLIAIIIAMICAFLPLMMRRSSETLRRKTVSEEMSFIETGVNRFIMHFDNAEYRFELNSEKTGIIAYEKDNSSNIVGKICFDKENNKLVAESYLAGDGEDWNFYYDFSNVTNMLFSDTGSEKANKLISCSISYDLKTAGQKYNVALLFITHAQGDVDNREI